MASPPKILFPAGIGDIYWSLIKLENFLKKKQLSKPDIYIGTRPDAHGSHNRAFPFLEMFPFVNSTGMILSVDEHTPRFWEKVYNNPDTGIFEDVLGCGYFIVYNGPINSGKALNEIDQEYVCTWEPEMILPSSVDSYRQLMLREYGPYIVYHFGTRGTYKYWTDEFNLDQIVNSIHFISESTHTIPILAGGIWDCEDEGLNHIFIETDFMIDMRGKTSLHDLFGMIQGARLVIGFPSGLSMLSPALGTKTVSLWSQLYPKMTAWNVIPPIYWDLKYFPMFTKNLLVSQFVEKVQEIYHV